MNIENLLGQAEGTQIRDAFKEIGIDFPEVLSPGYEVPGVYNGQQVVDAFKAYDKIHPGCVDMAVISSNMTGSQIRDAFRCILKRAVAPAPVIPAPVIPAPIIPTGPHITGSYASALPRHDWMPFGKFPADKSAAPDMSPDPAWRAGEFAELARAGGPKIHWDGTTWRDGVAPIPTSSDLIHNPHDSADWQWMPLGTVPPPYSPTAPTPTPAVRDVTRTAGFSPGSTGYLIGWWDGTRWQISLPPSS